MDQSSAAPVALRRARSLLAAVTVAIATGMLVLPGCGSSAGATTFQREAVSAQTADPFTKSVGTDQAGVTPPENVTGAYTGTIPGLYGGSGNNVVCDPAALVAFLEANAEKAAAWAGVLDIEASEIGAYVAQLTPVVLRTDTAVTNHGFKNGKATSVAAVLQAGTAVLVDDRGVPVVKCGCGNPLTPAGSTNDATYEGASWDGFTPESVITVNPARDPVTSIVIADPAGGGVRRPVGTTGPEDTPYVPGEEDPGTDGSSSGDQPDAGNPASDYPLDTDPNATVDGSSPSASLDDAPITLTGRSIPGADCLGIEGGPVEVIVTGRKGSYSVTLPSAALPGFPGLVFDVNPDGSIDDEITYEPPGAPGFTVTYHFVGRLDPGTKDSADWSLTGTLTTTSVNPPMTCTVRYDTSRRGEPVEETPVPTSTTPPPVVTTTYVGTYGLPGSVDQPGGFVTNDCARAAFLDHPFTIAVRVRDDVVGRGEVTVVGNGWNDGNVAIRSPVPTRDLHDTVSSGTFSAGGRRTYDSYTYQGEFRAAWSGGVAGSRTRPAEFPLTIRQTWHRDRDFVGWLTSSGGPEDYSCAYEVMAMRQG